MGRAECGSLQRKDRFCQGDRMRPVVMVVAQLVAGVSPGDDREAEDIRSTLAWMQRTDDVFRRVKPATPDRHLVSYVVPVDPDTGHFLLGEHLNAALWLPPGGHVEVDEHPATTARREAAEELQVDASNRLADRPLFLSVTETVGRDSGHRVCCVQPEVASVESGEALVTGPARAR